MTPADPSQSPLVRPYVGGLWEETSPGDPSDDRPEAALMSVTDAGPPRRPARSQAAPAALGWKPAAYRDEPWPNRARLAVTVTAMAAAGLGLVSILSSGDPHAPGEEPALPGLTEYERITPLVILPSELPDGSDASAADPDAPAPSRRPTAGTGDSPGAVPSSARPVPGEADRSPRPWPAAYALPARQDRGSGGLDVSSGPRLGYTVDFGDRPRQRLSTRLAFRTRPGASALVTVRADTPDGPSIGSFSVGNGHEGEWTTVPSTIRPLMGVHRIYIAFTMDVRPDVFLIADFTFS
ncbi:carbohydrate-binding protein [Streptomyces sp. NPDC055709]